MCTFLLATEHGAESWLELKVTFGFDFLKVVDMMILPANAA
jgi:hypothetical protein